MVPIPSDPLRRPKLEPPNPYWAGSKFLAWLSKQGRDALFSDCEDKWRLHNKNCPTPKLKNCSLEDYIKYLGPDLIKSGRSSYGKIVRLTPKGVDWAAEWALEYNEPRGHHGGPSLKKFPSREKN